MTSDVTYAVYFNSGQNSNSNVYTNNSNISRITINNSDQDYYQTGIIELYKCSQQDIGNSVDIFINDSLEFSGYVSRQQIHHKAGVTLYTYQLVGKTYDLWRYRTGSDTSYKGYSGYIASSLVRDYCSNIKGNSNTSDGSNFEKEIEFKDMSVGDALVTLIGYDGFKFYIDNNNSLIYYDPELESELYIKVEEDDIIDMSPIEEADEDLVNDVLVIGASEYYSKTKIPLPTDRPISNISSVAFRRNMYVAQRIKAEENSLSSIKMFLDRTIETLPSKNVQFEVWDNSTKTILVDDFDSMYNWSVTSNTFFDNGYLKLNTGYENINQNTEEAWSDHHYHAQIVKFSNPYTIESAFIYTDNKVSSPRTYWIELRDTTDGLLHTPNNVLSSGSVTIASLGSVLNLINLNPKYTVNTTDYYALVAHLGNPPTQEIRSHYKRTDVYGDGYCYKKYSDDGTTWFSNTTMDMYFGIQAFGNYSKSGYALSKPFGTPTRKLYTKFMKATLGGTTSSNKIYLSGSNSGNRNWRTLTNGDWYNFSFLNKFSSQIKIWLSSNGTYTPKVDSVTVEISDDTSGPGATPYSDNFDNYSYLSGATRKKILVSGGLLRMSSSTGIYDYRYVRPYAPYQRLNGVYNNFFSPSSQMVDSDTSSYAYTTIGSAHNFSLMCTLPTQTTIDELSIKGETSYDDYSLIINGIYLSGNWAGKSWVRVAYPNYHFERGVTETKYFPFDNNCVYYSVKKILISGGKTSTGTSYNYIFDIKLREAPLCKYSGTIQTKDFNSGVPIKYLMVSPVNEVYSSKITYSGSKNSGSTWYKLTRDTWTQLGDGGSSGQHLKLMYNMKPYTITTTNSSPHISTTSLKNSSPSIDSCSYGYSILSEGPGLPRSGTRIEFSNELYIKPEDISYPPSYSSYISYDFPKLKDDYGKSFDRENYFWIIMYAYSGSLGNNYWKYYYDSDSDYDEGMIAYSTGQTSTGTGVGVTWKSHLDKPSWVPGGSIIMEIGWRGDEQIRAAAVNEQSINKYGRHQKIVNDNRVNSFSLASSMAQAIIFGMENIPKKGNIIVEGIKGLKTTYKLSSNLVNLGIGGLWEIVSFTQNIDKNGFTTNINYGKQPFNIAKRITDLEKEVY